MTDLVLNPLGVPNFDLSQHIAEDDHRSEDGSVNAGAYSGLLFQKQQPYRGEHYYEYPKCVTFGKFKGVAKSAEHEEELKAKYAPAQTPPPQGAGNAQVPPAGQVQRPQGNGQQQPPRN